MKKGKYLLPILLALSVAGCVGALSGTAPLYHDLEYSFEPVTCAGQFKDSLRVWPFSASPPYDREQMIVLGKDHSVKFSSQLRWVALPGDLVSSMLLRDLVSEGMFIRVVSSAESSGIPLQMSGHIFRCAWDESSGSGRAVLDVTVELWGGEPKRAILFSKNYHLESPPSTTQGASDFANAMSQLCKTLSVQFRNDLCLKLKGNFSRVGG